MLGRSIICKTTPSSPNLCEWVQINRDLHFNTMVVAENDDRVILKRFADKPSLFFSNYISKADPERYPETATFCTSEVKKHFSFAVCMRCGAELHFPVLQEDLDPMLKPMVHHRAIVCPYGRHFLCWECEPLLSDVHKNLITTEKGISAEFNCFRCHDNFPKSPQDFEKSCAKYYVDHIAYVDEHFDDLRVKAFGDSGVKRNFTQRYFSGNWGCGGDWTTSHWDGNCYEPPSIPMLQGMKATEDARNLLRNALLRDAVGDIPSALILEYADGITVALSRFLRWANFSLKLRAKLSEFEELDPLDIICFYANQNE